MAEEIVYWCDWHLGKDPEVRVPGTPIVVSVERAGQGGTGPRRFDLCPECDAQILGPLRLLIENESRPLPKANGRPPGKAPGGKLKNPERIIRQGGDGLFVCPIPNCGKAYENQASMRGHMDMTHNQAWSVVHDQRYLPSAKPAANRVLTCPDCGRTIANPQGLAAHRRAKHGPTLLSGTAAK